MFQFEALRNVHRQFLHAAVLYRQIDQFRAELCLAYAVFVSVRRPGTHLHILLYARTYMCIYRPLVKQRKPRGKLTNAMQRIHTGLQMGGAFTRLCYVSNQRCSQICRLDVAKLVVLLAVTLAKIIRAFL